MNEISYKQWQWKERERDESSFFLLASEILIILKTYNVMKNGDHYDDDYYKWETVCRHKHVFCIQSFIDVETKKNTFG